MKELAKNKVRYILYRYQIDSKDLNVTLRLELLKKWIVSCVQFEEYEMASALKEKRFDLIRALRLTKVPEKHPVDKFFIKLKWLFRKLKRRSL